MSKIYLDAEFNPTTPDKAALIKVIDGDKIAFYRPPEARTQKAASALDQFAWIALGQRLGVDFETIPPAEWVEGCEHEAGEHLQTVNGDAATIARIALDHLNEDPRYYEKLRSIEEE